MSLKILSCFDGISCAQVALNRLGLYDYTYYASEVDQNTIDLTRHHFPNTKHVGEVEKLKAEDYQDLDLICGGSPCQSFSIGGKGKKFEDPRGKLVFQFIRMVQECKPKYFLLENVKMSKGCSDFISSELGVEPVLINSNLVSAQSRERLYWTNIPFDLKKDIPNKGVMVKDILEADFDPADIVSFQGVVKVYHRLSSNLLMPWGGIMTDAIYKRGEVPSTISGYPQGNRIYNSSHKTSTLMASSGGRGNKANLVFHDGKIRKFNRVERERLQTLPEGYTATMSKGHAYTAIGNGWTVDIIKEIFKNMKTFSEV